MEVLKAVFSASLSAIRIWLLSLNSSMNENMACLVAKSINRFIFGRGNSSLG